MAAREQGGTDRTTPPTPGTSPAEGRRGPRSPEAGRTPANRNRLGWIAITVAAALTAWQIVYAITAPSMTDGEAYESVGLLLTLVLAVGAVVLGIVALSQRVSPRWPAVAALAIGSYAFVVAVASWIGELMY